MLNGIIDYEQMIVCEKTENLNGKSIIVKIMNCKKVLEISVTNCNRSFSSHIIAIILFGFFNVFLLLNHIVSHLLLCTCFVIFFDFCYRFAFSVKQEKLLIIKSLGYQIESKCGLSESKLYIPWQNIKSVFVNEVVSKQRVIFLLTLISKESTKLIPLFTETMPRLHTLEAMYESIESCLS